MHLARLLSAGTVIVLATTALAAETSPSGSDRIAELSWMAGSWSGSENGVDSEEHWTDATGGALLGLHKDVRGGRMTSFEYLRVSVGESGDICYIASPGGGGTTSFCAVEMSEKRIVFENLGHDFPQRILYWLDDAGRLHARIEGPGESGPVTKEWIWSRMPD